MRIKTLIGWYMDTFKYYSLHQIWNMAKIRITPTNSTYLMYKPFDLLMHVTSKCNYKCRFCFGKAPSVPKDFLNYEDMSFRNFIKIVNKFTGATSLRISGGEPFLNKDIFKMIKYANSKKMEVSTSTNGSLLHDKIDQIVSSSISNLNISINADNSLEYGKIHDVNNFDTVLENISELVKKRMMRNSQLKITVSHVTTKKNYKRIPYMISLAENLGVDALFFYNMISIGLPGYPKDLSLYENDSEVIEFIENIEPPNSKLRVTMPSLFSHINIKRLCRMPFTTLPVFGNGKVSICCLAIPRKECGNVLGNNNVWNNSCFKSIRKILIDDSETLPELCKKCNQMYRPYKVLIGK